MIWLNSKNVAELLGITDRAIRKTAKCGKYGDKIRYINGRGGNGGKILQIALEALPENIQQKYHIEKLNKKPTEATKNINRIFDNCNEAQKSSAIQKLKAIEAYKNYEYEQVKKNLHFSKTQCKNDFIEHWNKENEEFQLSQTTLYRMINSYNNQGVAGLIDNRGGHNKNRSSIPDEIWQEFKSIYLTQTQPSIKQCYEDIRLLSTEKGIVIPSYPVFKYHVKNSISKAEITLGRYGKKAYTDSFEPTSLRDYSKIKPNQVWVADGHIWDVFVTIYENGKKIIKSVRLWGVYWMDMCTRKIVSYRLCVGNPNANTVLLAFREAVLKYGIPEEVILDNGKDYKTMDLFNTGKYKQSKLEAFTRFNLTQLFDEKTQDKFFIKPIASQMEIIVHFAIPYNAKAKPIERAFSTLESQFSKRFASYLGRNTLNRPEQLSTLSKEEYPTQEEFEELHSKYVFDIYNNRSHSGEGMNGKSPNEVYAEKLTQKRTSTPETMRLWLMRTTRALTIGKNGIKVNKVNYYNKEFVKLQGKEKVFVRYDPADTSFVEVYDLQDKYLFKAFEVPKMSFNPTEEEYEALYKRKKEAFEIVRDSIPKPPKGYGTVAYIDKMLDLQIAELKEQGKVEILPNVPIEFVRNPILEENARKSKAMEEENHEELLRIEMEEALKANTETYQDEEHDRETDLLFEYYRNA